MSPNVHRDDKPSREAEFSTALWRLDKDWLEQREAKPKPRPGWVFLFPLVAPPLYLVSMAPAVLILRLAGFPYKGVLACRYFYYPVLWLQGHPSVAILAGVSWIAYAVVFWLLSRR